MTRRRVIEEEQLRRFTRKARNAIEDAGDSLTPEERRNLVRSIVTDYNPLPASAAEEFLEEYSDLITNGWDARTSPDKRSPS
jgi:hypothetical protein